MNKYANKILSKAKILVDKGIDMNNFRCEILLERHGQSIGNEKRIFLGHTDIDLSELGYKQAQLCAEAMKDEKIDCIYSSDLIRAYNTALPHAALRGLTVIAKKELREFSAGKWENVPVEELKDKYKNEYLYLWREHFASFSAPHLEVESVEHLAERIHSQVLEIARAHIGERVLIATHAAAIRAFWGKISGYVGDEASSVFDFPTNASISRVGFDGERLIPIIYSDDSMLGAQTSRWQG